MVVQAGSREEEAEVVLSESCQCLHITTHSPLKHELLLLLKL